MFGAKSLGRFDVVHDPHLPKIQRADFLPIKHVPTSRLCKSCKACAVPADLSICPGSVEHLVEAQEPKSLGKYLPARLIPSKGIPGMFPAKYYTYSALGGVRWLKVPSRSCSSFFADQLANIVAGSNSGLLGAPLASPGKVGVSSLL